MNTELTSEDDFYLLKDEPLSPEDIDKFGYKEVAEGITKLILKSEPPTTIGLYGQWGVGKSSICELITNEIKTQHKEKYEVFYFDTWKYERDSLRRQFLIELDEKVLGGALEYREGLNQTLTTTYTLNWRTNLKENVKQAFTKFSLSAVFVLPLVALFLLLNFINYNDATNIEFIKNIFSYTFLLFAFTEFIKILRSSIKILEGTKEVAKTDSAEGFEFYYEKALQQLGGRKLLVIVDNLDRVEHSKAVSLLSDIKTFLATSSKKTANNSIFLIPCDSVAIHAQLKEVYKDIDPEEFLRKFFSFSVKVPKFVNLELDAYILDKLKETKINDLDNPNVAFVASRGFRNSPREIIQFTNSLVALYYIAKQRGVSFVLTEENLPFLAKVLIIRLKWPDKYSEIEERLLRSSTPLNDIIDDVTKKLEEKDNEALKKFHSATDIKPSDERKIDVFFSLKNIQERDLPEWESFIYSAEDKDLSNVGVVVKSLEGNDEQIKKLANILYSDYLPKNTVNSQKIRNVISSLLIEVPFEKLWLFNKVLEGMLATITDRAESFLIENGIFHIEDNNYDKISQKAKQELVRITVRSLGEIENKETEYEQIVSYFSQASVFLERNKSLLSSQQLGIIMRVRKAIFVRLDPRTLFTETDTNKAEKLNWFEILLGEKAFSDGSVPENLRQLFYLLQHPPLQADKELLKKLLEITLTNISNTHLASLPTEETSLSYIRQFVSQICALANSFGTSEIPQLRFLMVHIIFKMLNWTPDLPQRGELANNITRLLTDVNLKAEDIVHQLGIDNLYSFTKSVGTDWLLQRSRRKYDLLKLLPEIKLTEDEVSSIQNELINNNYSDFLKLLNDHGNKIQENYGGNQNFKINLQDNMLTKLQTNITIEEMEKTIRALFTLGMTSQLINNLYNALIELANRGEEFKNLVKKITKVKKNFEVFNEDQRKVLSAL